MNEKGELTNVPDYQKIRQTNQSGGNQGWSEDVETLEPSPVVCPPGTTSPHQQHLMQGSGGQPQQNLYSSSSKFSLDGNIKASWESPGKSYGAIKYEDESPSAYIPQGYSRQVTKYIDANGVERRFIRRTVSPNRRSFTEGLLGKASSSDFSPFPGSGSGLRNASSQKNLYPHDYSPPQSISAGESSTRREFTRFSNSVMTGQQKVVGYSSPAGAGGDDQWKQIGGSHLALKTHQEGLRHWQQQHQEELLHQHLETQALYESPTSQSLLLGGPDKSLNKLTTQDEPPARWEPVRRAADTIIREKNMIIDKLKNRILELEEDFKDSENKLRQALISKEDDEDLAKDKLQGLQHANATLKERLNEERAKKNSEIDDLEIKLGSAEHEIQKLKETLRNKASEQSDIQTQLIEKTQESEAWHQKFKESCEEHQEMKRKLDGFKRYLDELPTIEESQIQAQQVMSLREENVGLKSKCESLEKKLSQVRKVVTSRDFRIRELEEREKDLEHKVEDVNNELDRLRDTEGSEFFKIQTELSQVKGDKERLAIDLEKAKKLLETTHQKLRQVEIKYQGEVKALQERLAQEEETVGSLRTEIADREIQIAKMRKSMKEMGVQSQEQLEQTLILRQQIKQLQQRGHYMDDASSGYSSSSSSSAGGRISAAAATATGGSSGSITPLQSKFMHQLSLCVSELKALVNVCSQGARGEDPDISVLLGVKNSMYEDGSMRDEKDAAGADQAKTLSQWLTSLGELRREVDKMRGHICNKYAEDMGDNITCATQ